MNLYGGREGFRVVRNSRSKRGYMVMMNVRKDFKNICSWRMCPHAEVKDKPVLCALDYPTCKTLHLGRGKSMD